MPTVQELEQFKQFVVSNNPNLSSSQRKQLDDFINSKRLEIIAQAGIPLGEIQTDPDLARIQAGQAEAGTLKPELSADEKKKQAAKDRVANTINTLENMYFGLDDESRQILAFGRQKGISESLRAKLFGANPKAKAYMDALKTARVPLAKGMGEVGNLTASEQNNAIASLGKLTSTPEEAVLGFATFRKIAQLPERNILSEVEDVGVDTKGFSKPQAKLAKDGIKKQKQLRTEITPENLQTVGSQKRENLEFEMGDNRLMFGLAKVQEFLGQKPVLPGAGGLIGKGLTRGSSVGTGTGAGVGKFLQQLLRPGETIQEKGIGALVPSGQEAKEIATTGAGAGLLDFLFTGGKVGTSPLRPTKFALKKRGIEAAKSTGKVSGDELVKAGEGFLKKASPTDTKTIQKFVEAAKSKFSGKTFGAEESLEKLAEFNKAFTAAGKVGKSGKAGFNAALSRNIREQLQRVAPEVAKAQKGLARNIGIQKALGKFGGRVGGAGLGAGAALGINELIQKLRGE